MANNFKNDEQRVKWNKYNNAYSKKTYRAISLKLNKANDQDVINYLETKGESPTKVVRELVREKLGTGK